MAVGACRGRWPLTIRGGARGPPRLGEYKCGASAGARVSLVFSSARTLEDLVRLFSFLSRRDVSREPRV
jgi:hypothetical protein